MQEYHIIVDCPEQLHILHSLMERGKLTEKQYETEERNFVEYVRERCRKIPLFSRHCVVTGTIIFLWC